jgi:hypothetical protein
MKIESLLPRAAHRMRGIARSALAAAAALIALSGAARALDVTVGSATVAPGNTVTVPVTVTGMAGTSRSFQINLSFNGAVLTAPVAAAGTGLPAGFNFASNSPSTGAMIALGFEMGPGAVVLNGQLFRVTFTAAPGAAGGQYAVTIAAATILDQNNQQMAIANRNAGTITVTGGGVGTAPTVTAQPSNATVTAGQTATFTVAAAGTAPLVYQWESNAGAGWTAVAGAAAASYTTPVTVAGDSGKQFRCAVTNAAGNVTSNAATLTVNVPVAPAFTAQPSDAMVLVGQTATFTAAATGTAPLTYQWESNPGAGWTAIAGATGLSYTTPAAAAENNGAQFRCVAANAAGSVNSNAATLSVTVAPIAPAVAAQPADATVASGQTATFAIAVTGTLPITYQWQSNTAGAGWLDIAGAAGTSYTTPVTAAGDNGTQFRAVATNAVGSATSNAATLTVITPVAPAITAQPLNAAVNAGQAATFTVAASGTAPLAYQWQSNAIAGWTAIAGAVNASYTTPALAAIDSGTQYRCVVTNAAGNVTSNAATVTVTVVTVAPAITLDPSSASVLPGQITTFTVEATGTAPLAYQWQSNSGAGWSAIAGETGASYTKVAVASDNGRRFQCVVTNSAGSATSGAATLSVAGSSGGSRGCAAARDGAGWAIFGLSAPLMLLALVRRRRAEASREG